MAKAERRAFCRLVAGVIVVATAISLPANAQGRKERKDELLKESEKPKAVTGGSSFKLSKSYDTAYDASLTFLKKRDYAIDQASKEIGQIITAITIEGGWKQTGTRVYVTLIKEDQGSTSIKLAVSKQKRYKAAQTEPWGDPAVDAKESEKLAGDLRLEIEGSPNGAVEAATK